MNRFLTITARSLRGKALVALTLGLVGIAPHGASAASETPIGEAGPRDFSRAELISTVETVAPAVPFWVGVRVRMKPHAHIYWRNPGDAGMPMRLSWRAPEGFRFGRIQWPTPILFKQGEFGGYGYEDEVILPIRVTPPPVLRSGESIRIEASADWLACTDICVPQDAELAVDLVVTSDNPAPNESTLTALDEALGSLPRIDENWTARILSTDQDSVSLAIQAPDEIDLGSSDILFFSYRSEALSVAKRQKLTRHAPNDIVLTIPRSPYFTGPIERLEGVLKITPDETGAEPTRAPPAMSVHIKAETI